MITQFQANSIKDSLCNDEVAGNQELIEYFMVELGVSREDAEKCVEKRPEFLRSVGLSEPELPVEIKKEE